MSQSADVDSNPIEYGVLPLPQVIGQEGIDFLKGIVEGRNPAPPIAKVFDFRLDEVAPGRAVFRGSPDERFYNPIGTVHGGYTATLLDSCMACAIHTTLRSGEGYTTMEIKVNYVRGLTDAVGEVSAIGELIHRGGRMATAEGRLVDSNGKLYAHGSTTCLIMKA